jgi:hypothetical protein
MGFSHLKVDSIDTSITSKLQQLTTDVQGLITAIGNKKPTPEQKIAGDNFVRDIKLLSDEIDKLLKTNPPENIDVLNEQKEALKALTQKLNQVTKPKMSMAFITKTLSNIKPSLGSISSLSPSSLSSISDIKKPPKEFFPKPSTLFEELKNAFSAPRPPHIGKESKNRLAGGGIHKVGLIEQEPSTIRAANILDGFYAKLKIGEIPGVSLDQLKELVDDEAIKLKDEKHIAKYDRRREKLLQKYGEIYSALFSVIPAHMVDEKTKNSTDIKEVVTGYMRAYNANCSHLQDNIERKKQSPNSDLVELVALNDNDYFILQRNIQEMRILEKKLENYKVLEEFYRNRQAVRELVGQLSPTLTGKITLDKDGITIKQSSADTYALPFDNDKKKTSTDSLSQVRKLQSTDKQKNSLESFEVAAYNKVEKSIYNDLAKKISKVEKNKTSILKSRYLFNGKRKLLENEFYAAVKTAYDNDKSNTKTLAFHWNTVKKSLRYAELFDRIEGKSLKGFQKRFDDLVPHPRENPKWQKPTAVSTQTYTAPKPR